MKTNRALAVLLCVALLLTGCTFWLSADASGVHIGYSGPDLVPGTEAPHEATPTPEVVQWTPQPTAAPPACVGVITAQPHLNVRERPAGARVGTVKQGVEVEVISSAGDWLQIVSPPGWVSGVWVRLGDGC